jgi:hypothetical protein
MKKTGERKSFPSPMKSLLNNKGIKTFSHTKLSALDLGIGFRIKAD